MAHLAEFFREKKTKAERESAGVDWDQQRQEWLAALQDLYQQVQQFLEQPIREGSARVENRQINITEAHLGEYATTELLLVVGDERVRFVPKGRNVLGAAGRVDVLGEAGEAMFVLEPGRQWLVVRSKYPHLQLVPLTPESFEEALRAVMRP